jgi:predicted dehydrogenase
MIVGLGSIGRRHLHNLRTLGEHGIVLLRSGFGGGESPCEANCAVERDWDAALAHAPRAAIVSNPTACHLETALRAARAGCHLLIEKPIGHEWRGVEALREEVERRRLVVLVGYQFRFHPALRGVKQWLDEGAIGAVVSAHVRWGEYLPAWHAGEDYRRGYSARRDLGGGVVLTLSHPLDYLRWLLGEVVAVQALTALRSGLELDVEDTALISLAFASGALAQVSLDYVEWPSRHTLEIVGREGTIRWAARDHAATLSDGEGRVRDVHFPPPGFERNSLFVDELRHFCACLRGEERPLCTLTDGERALTVALAALASAEEGRLVRVG